MEIEMLELKERINHYQNEYNDDMKLENMSSEERYDYFIFLQRLFLLMEEWQQKKSELDALVSSRVDRSSYSSTGFFRIIVDTTGTSVMLAWYGTIFSVFMFAASLVSMALAEVFGLNMFNELMPLLYFFFAFPINISLFLIGKAPIDDFFSNFALTVEHLEGPISYFQGSNIIIYLLELALLVALFYFIFTLPISLLSMINANKKQLVINKKLEKEELQLKEKQKCAKELLITAVENINLLDSYLQLMKKIYKNKYDPNQEFFRNNMTYHIVQELNIDKDIMLAELIKKLKFIKASEELEKRISSLDNMRLKDDESFYIDL